MVKILLCGFAAAIMLSACETTSSRPYTASTRNVIEIQNHFKGSDARVQVGAFDVASEVETDPSCRALGSLEVAPGKSIVAFVRDALEEELFLAQVYDSNAPTTINGRLDELDFNSFGTGSWKIALHVSSNALPEGYSISTDYSFKTSWTALKACQNVIDAFTPAVNDLFGKVIDHPDFDALVGASSAAEDVSS